METKEDMSTLASCMNALRKKGFKKEITVSPKGLQFEGKDKTYKPEDVHIDNFYRFEGESNPGDMSILYAIESKDGYRGTLINAYGPYANERISAFIKKVEDYHKKKGEKDLDKGQSLT